MNRRALLAALGSAASLAGCLGRGTPGSGTSDPGTTPGERTTDGTANGDGTTAPGTDEGGSTGTSGTPEPTRTPPGSPPPDATVQRRISIASETSVPDGVDVRIEVELLRSAVTADHTAWLRVTTTNTGTRRRISVGEEYCSMFNRTLGESSPEGLWLLDPSSSQHVDREGDRWTRDRAADEPRGFVAVACVPRTYAPGESVSSTYLVWDDYRTDGYMEPGTYRFSRTIRVSPPGSEGTTTEGGEPTATFDWGFALRVETP